MPSKLFVFFDDFFQTFSKRTQNTIKLVTGKLVKFSCRLHRHRMSMVASLFERSLQHVYKETKFSEFVLSL